jgi:Domain of unknown function (DUF4440)
MNARDVVELVYRTLSDHGPDAVAEFVDPEATLVTADGARIEGREKVLDHLRRERAAFPTWSRTSASWRPMGPSWCWRA